MSTITKQELDFINQGLPDPKTYTPIIIQLRVPLDPKDVTLVDTSTVITELYTDLDLLKTTPKQNPHELLSLPTYLAFKVLDIDHHLLGSFIGDCRYLVTYLSYKI